MKVSSHSRGLCLQVAYVGAAVRSPADLRPRPRLREESGGGGGDEAGGAGGKRG